MVADGAVEVTWLPFELHPEIPAEGMSIADYFGHLPGRLEQIERSMQSLAAQVGLTMRRRERLINSRKALATAEFARERGAFDQVHQALFRMHWEGPGQLDDVEDLKRVVASAGLDPAELEAALQDGRYERVIDDNQREAMAMGVNAIPAHLFGRRFLVIGAYPDEYFRQVLRRLEDEA
jgi:predicted DsbA family dithiol-disulfide isomerase